MAEKALLLFSTFASLEEARQISRLLVEERLAACANILPAVESIYRWQAVVETATETMVIFKTNEDRYYALERRLKELHSYEVPEMLAIKPDVGLPAYFDWIDQSCR